MSKVSEAIKAKENVNETTAMAHETTLLDPRFYTTNFREMDDLNVDAVRRIGMS